MALPFSKAQNSSLPFIQIAAVIVLIAGAVVFFVWFIGQPERAQPRPQVQPAAGAPKQESDQLAMMNILNRYQREEGARDATEKNPAKNEGARARLARTEQELRALSLDQTLAIPRDRLVETFALWQASLDEKKDLQPVRKAFIELGTEYPWLNTLAWLIVLNRL